MNAAFDRLRHEAYALPTEEKAELIDFLLLSLHNTPSPEVEAAWEKELAARQKAIDEGRAKFMPWEDVRAKYDKYFEKTRSAR